MGKTIDSNIKDEFLNLEMEISKEQKYIKETKTPKDAIYSNWESFVLQAEKNRIEVERLRELIRKILP